jgi:hypothetical protein
VLPGDSDVRAGPTAGVNTEPLIQDLDAVVWGSAQLESRPNSRVGLSRDFSQDGGLFIIEERLPERGKIILAVLVRLSRNAAPKNRWQLQDLVKVVRQEQIQPLQDARFASIVGASDKVDSLQRRDRQVSEAPEIFKFE